MATVFLHLDRQKHVCWALVRCDGCARVYKYPALEAARSGIKCINCDHAMDVRKEVIADANAYPAVYGKFLLDVADADRVGK